MNLRNIAAFILFSFFLLSPNTCLRADNSSQAVTEPAGDAISLPSFGSDLDRILNTELWKIDNHSVTGKKTVAALFILFVGLMLVKLFTWFLCKRLLPRLSFNDHTISVVQKLTFYEKQNLNTPFCKRG